MRFEDKLKKQDKQEIWDEYCGFLDLSMAEYMQIQNRLLTEQLHLLSQCELGRRFLGDKPPSDVEGFRQVCPLTTFGDYADILLLHRTDKLPGPVSIWLQTTWEGGDKPFKCAPYTPQMLEAYRDNILAAMILSTANARGSFKIKSSARVLYSLAPLPYASGLFPDLMAPEIKIQFLPSYKEARKMSFGESFRKGFSMSLKQGMDQFYGMTSIVYNMSKSFGELASGGKKSSILGMTPKMIYRVLRAKYISRRDGRQIRPGDLFNLDGFVCVGTDTALYKDELEQLWGRRPLELAGGTETALLGTETWMKNGLVFFPDNCFYEFIPEQDMLRNLKDPTYTPRTYLMNELTAGEKYELVMTSLKGGAFVRYRVGDVYRCLRLKNPAEGLDLPQFEYIDRIPTVIDIAGFTRITCREIDTVIQMSGLKVKDYVAVKEYDETKHSFVHLYVEMDDSDGRSGSIDANMLKEHLSIYFRSFDSDYEDLKKIIGVDPLSVTLLKSGSIEGYERMGGHPIERINPTKQDIVDLLHFAGADKEAGA